MNPTGGSVRNDSGFYFGTKALPKKTQIPPKNVKEVMAIVVDFSNNLYCKAGKFIPPYGYRLEDHNAFIRNRIAFDHSQPQKKEYTSLALDWIFVTGYQLILNLAFPYRGGYILLITVYSITQKGNQRPFTGLERR